MSRVRVACGAVLEMSRRYDASLFFILFVCCCFRFLSLFLSCVCVYSQWRCCSNYKEQLSLLFFLAFLTSELFFFLTPFRGVILLSPSRTWIGIRVFRNGPSSHRQGSAFVRVALALGFKRQDGIPLTYCDALSLLFALINMPSTSARFLSSSTKTDLFTTGVLPFFCCCFVLVLP